MDAFKCIETKLDVREFTEGTVPSEVRTRVLEAARLTGSAHNRQAWHFILVTTKAGLADLAESCPQGPWVAGADFAVIILTSPRLAIHMLDAGRALQDMQLAAWDSGVASGLTTVFSEEGMRIQFNIPREFSISAVLGFGYPKRKVLGGKSRKPLSELVSQERYGAPLERGRL
ncbi:MAG: nitroreductase family protein [Thaumarchaeota archaeon]|nr:nitroreductase family protein [Nitrososphaerota archaeon]